MPDSKKMRDYIERVCPYCGQMSITPLAVGVRSGCPHCGKDWHASGVEIQGKETRKLIEELEKRRKREIDADKERE